MFATPPVLADVAIAEGAGHDVQHSHAEWLAQTILDFLKKHQLLHQ